jgi:hypothetical protein
MGAGFVTGIFALIKALHFAKQGDDTTALYTGIFGITAALISLQKIMESIRALFSKRKANNKEHQHFRNVIVHLLNV